MTHSIATGAALTPETWADFVTRLRHDCEGEGVRDHSTADAVFMVEAKRIISGLDLAYCDTNSTLVHCDDSSWYSPKEYWDGCHEDEEASLNERAQAEHAKDFMALHVLEQWDILAALPDHTVTGYVERWEYVNAHFTKDAAEAFIRRKKHDYPEGLRVYVDSQCYAWEFNTIKEAIMTGRLVLAEPA